MTHTERTCLTGAVIGAALGLAVSYLYATDEGAHRREGVWRAVNRARWDLREGRQLWHELSDVWTQFQRDSDAAAVSARRWSSGDVA